MSKRSSARRKMKYSDESDSVEPQVNNDSFRNQKNRRKLTNTDNNIVDFNCHSRQLSTAYTPQQQKTLLKAKTPSQQQYINAINSHSLTFGMGPAGTGKSYCAGALAAQALEAGQIERIIITRPAVEAGEQLGFLPGQLEDKFGVYIDAFRDILIERLGRGVVEYCLRHGRIVGAPLAYMRGKTFNDNTFVILDEAQNTSPLQMKMFLTRIGENCKVVVNGDIMQSDICGANGLQDATNRLKNINGVYIHHFEKNDCVRSGLVRELLACYELG